MKLVKNRTLKLINEVELPLYEHDGKYYSDAEQLHNWLEVKTPFPKWFKRRINGYNFKDQYVKYYGIIENNELIIKQLSEFNDSQQASRKGYKLKYFINIFLLKELINMENIHKSKKIEIIKNCNDFLQKNSNEDINITTVRKEYEFISELEEALKPFGIKGEKQFNINGYRIDYYIPSLKIAIEYDENNHKNYDYSKQEGRELNIKQDLQCRFIRVSDLNTMSYNIGYVIKNIFDIRNKINKEYKQYDRINIKDNLSVGEIYGNNYFVKDMLQHLGKRATIISINEEGYLLDIDDKTYYWSKEMFN